jgi:hypothetical protein
MAGNKYLAHDGAGGAQEVAGQQDSSGASAGMIVALNSSSKIDATLLPTGIAADTVTAVASEALAAGDLVNLYSNAGTVNARKADASGGAAKQAHGFVLASVSSSGTATVYMEGSNTSASSLTVGNQFLSGSTPGKSTATAPTTTAYIVQRVGFAVSATLINFEGNAPITLA